MTLPPSPGPAGRIASVDVYRGFVMFLIMTEVFRLGVVAAAYPGNPVWEFVAFHQKHVPWTGCSLHDLIQPSFSFLVGVALPFSLSSRLSRGVSRSGLWIHTLKRALILVLLGIFLRSMHQTQTNFTFEDTLSQIGLGYPFLFALGFARPRTQWAVFGSILVAYWALFAFFPLSDPVLPGAAGAGGTPPWQHQLTGFEAHWNKNANPAWAFDRWFLNLFPRESTFLFHKGGYTTLNFIPTLATMILGLFAGQWLKERRSDLLAQFIRTGLILSGLALVLSLMGVSPIVKRIWTPGWVLFSGGWCFLLLAAFYWLADIKQIRRPFYFLLVFGANSIAAYVMVGTVPEFIDKSLQIHFGEKYGEVVAAPFQFLFVGTIQLALMWLLLHWMYTRKIFIKI